jgi:hypothetical protein
MAPRLATQQAKDLSSKSTTWWDAYSLSLIPLLYAGIRDEMTRGEDEPEPGS